MRTLTTSLLAASSLLAAGTIAHAAEPLVTTDWLESAPRADLAILDIRSGETAAADFETAHVPGAVHAPYPGVWRATIDGVPGLVPVIDSLEDALSDYGVDPEDHVVIVPAGLSASEFGAAARVYWTLTYLGHDAVSILDGGLTAWTEEGRPVESGPATPDEAVFVAEINPSVLATTEDVARIAESGGAALIDARPDAQFLGEAKHDAATRFGRIPGAIQLDQSTVYDPASQRLKDPAELASLVPTELGKDEPVVSYCNTGHWAATNWFVLSEVLGREDVRLYDASMVGYTRIDDLPLVIGAEG